MCLKCGCQHFCTILPCWLFSMKNEIKVTCVEYDSLRFFENVSKRRIFLFWACECKATTNYSKKKRNQMKCLIENSKCDVMQPIIIILEIGQDIHVREVKSSSRFRFFVYFLFSFDLPTFHFYSLVSVDLTTTFQQPLYFSTSRYLRAK